MKRDDRDPQVELVRRYARILRSAPAEAMRVQAAPVQERGPGLIVPPPSVHRAERMPRRSGARSAPAS
ncbi:hypothetical protein DSM104299_05221 [Baekduia alba]|uniref:hypothetical protein n=1 Tax=Baekduia alba TaxID=2997333 RepID=UPI00234225B5|nr:hypothetical protein [Baekduia alba]WCB96462.1 hypothetical protein DSM104299_05221 [Baekduia alba]